MADLRSELNGIYKRHGKLTASVVHDEVADPGHPLHNRYEWNDAVGAYQYRLIQIAEDIRSVRVEYKTPTGETETTRQWWSVREQAGREGYAPIDEIAANPVSLEMQLRELNREVAHLKRKYGHLEGFAQAMHAATA